MSFKYILFDQDGTLTDPKEGITKSVQHALRAFGIDEPDLDQLVSFIGPPLIESFRDFYDFTPEQALEGVAKYREYFCDRGIFENKVIPGIPRLLQNLKENGKILCLATSKPEPFARKILEHFDLMQWFDETVGASLDESRGTKKDVIEDALRRLQIGEKERRETVMVGDRKHDILAASALELSSVGVTFGYAPEGELKTAGAGHIVSSVEELEAYLLK